MRTTPFPFSIPENTEQHIMAETTETKTEEQPKAPETTAADAKQPEEPKKPEKSWLQKYWWVFLLLLAAAAVYFFRNYSIVAKVAFP